MARPSPEWLIERGVGEDRAMLIDGDEVVAAKIHWPGELYAGQLAKGVLVSKASGANRGTARLDNGAELLVSRLPRDVTEGATVTFQVTRAAIAERGRFKMAQGRCVRPAEMDKAIAQDAGPLPQGKEVTRFPSGLWEEVWFAASEAALPFTGGQLVIDAVPAMTLIDIDCSWPEEAYHNAIPTIARGLRWFDIGGNIGIDFPTIVDKRDRKAYDARLAECLDGWSHESTAMNGFGFVQLVARLNGPSLLHRFATSRTATCARAAMRAAERVEGAGETLLIVNPAIKSKIKPEWLDELRRRTGREVRIEVDPGLALEAPHAQIVSL
ncbi:ribonuclease [Erythrobacter sp. Alg231-14]|uniref:ribonuclease n=1 Tax=Erythrobacter sp. Alg231-14 TaxID=1922225 RepID=UPI00307CA012